MISDARDRFENLTPTPSIERSSMTFSEDVHVSLLQPEGRYILGSQHISCPGGAKAAASSPGGVATGKFFAPGEDVDS